MNDAILLVEDDASDATLAMRALRRSNLTNPIICRESAEEALRYLEQVKGDVRLILLDLKLAPGGLDGFGFIRELKTLSLIHNWLPVPIIVLTEDAGSKARAYDLGVQQHFTKPVDADKLWVKIRMLELGWSIVAHR